jgi:hypothetical protein
MKITDQRQEWIDSAIKLGAYHKSEGLAIQMFGDWRDDDGEIVDAYLQGYDPNGKYVAFTISSAFKKEDSSEVIKENSCSDEQHYADMKEFFIENLETLQFKPYLPFCSCCGSDKPNYIGMIPNASGNLVSFAFCVNCRDGMTLKQNAIRASRESIGA